MAKDRETLNERYMRFSYTNVDGGVRLGHTFWYQFDFDMKDDGLSPDDFYFTGEDHDMVMRWRDNDSPYVDHNP